MYFVYICMRNPLLLSRRCHRCTFIASIIPKLLLFFFSFIFHLLLGNFSQITSHYSHYVFIRERCCCCWWIRYLVVLVGFDIIMMICWQTNPIIIRLCVCVLSAHSPKDMFVRDLSHSAKYIHTTYRNYNVRSLIVCHTAHAASEFELLWLVCASEWVSE